MAEEKKEIKYIKQQVKKPVPINIGKPKQPEPGKAAAQPYGEDVGGQQPPKPKEETKQSDTGGTATENPPQEEEEGADKETKGAMPTGGSAGDLAKRTTDNIKKTISKTVGGKTKYYLAALLSIGNIWIVIGILFFFGFLMVACTGQCGKKVQNPLDLGSKWDMKKLKLLKALENIKTGGPKYILDESNDLLTIFENGKKEYLPLPEKEKGEALALMDQVITDLNFIITNKGNIATEAVKKEIQKRLENIASNVNKIIDLFNSPDFGKIGNFGDITNSYGYARPVEGGTPDTSYKDDGLDIQDPVGTNVMAIGDGRIAFADTTGAQIKPPWNTENGGGVTQPNYLGSMGLYLNDGRYVFYTHLSMIDLNLHDGVVVKKGQIMAKSGRARDSNHLHIGIYDYKNGPNWSPAKVQALWYK